MLKQLSAILFLLFTATGCLTPREEIFGRPEKATATVLFELENQHKGGKLYGFKSTIFNIDTKTEYEIRYSDSVKILHLPPGIYALVENISRFDHGYSVSEVTVAETPEESPWFVALENTKLCLGKIVYDYPNDKVRVSNNLRSLKKSLPPEPALECEYLPFAFHPETKAELRERFPKKGKVQSED